MLLESLALYMWPCCVMCSIWDDLLCGTGSMKKNAGSSDVSRVQTTSPTL